MSKNIKLTLLVALLSVFSMSALATELTLKVNNISKAEGHLMVALFDSKDGYDNDKTMSSYKRKVANKNEVFIFKDLPDGEYAIKIYHDENDNGKLDTNMFGIPKEGYGFSNNGGRFGPADYEDAKFDIKGETTIEINIR